MIFYCRFEGADLLDEDLVEVALEVLHLMQEVVLEEEVQVGVVMLLELVYLALQELLRLFDDLVQLV